MCTKNNNDYLMNKIKEHIFEVPTLKKNDYHGFFCLGCKGFLGTVNMQNRISFQKYRPNICKLKMLIS